MNGIREELHEEATVLFEEVLDGLEPFEIPEAAHFLGAIIGSFLARAPDKVAAAGFMMVLVDASRSFADVCEREMEQHNDDTKH